MATRKNGSGAVRLPERFTVEAAADVLADIRTRAGKSDTVRIDASAVTAADTAGLQLLAAARRDLVAEGKSCELDGLPESVADSARLLGLAPILGGV